MWPLDWPYSVKGSHWFSSLEQLRKSKPVSIRRRKTKISMKVTIDVVYWNIICIFVCLWTALQALQNFYPDGKISFFDLIPSSNTEICEQARAAFRVSQNSHFKSEKQSLAPVPPIANYICTALRADRFSGSVKGVKNSGLYSLKLPSYLS